MQGRISVEINDLFQFRFVSDPRFSPSGRWISFFVTRICRERNTYQSDLWVWDVRNESARPLTEEGVQRLSFWSEDDGLVAGVPKDGATTFYRIDPDSGECRTLFVIPLAVDRIKPLENGCYALTCDTGAPYNGRYHVLEEAPYCLNGKGITAGRRKALYIYCADTNSLCRITDENTDAGDFVYRAGTLVFQATPWRDYLPYPYGPAFYTWDLQSGSVRQLTDVGRINSFALCFWKDRELLFSGIEDCPGRSMGQKTDFYTLDLDSGTPRRFADVDMKIGYNGSGSDAKYGGGRGICLGQDGVYFLAPLGDGSSLHRMGFEGDLQYHVTEEADFTGSIESFDICGDRLVCAKMPQDGLAELYLDGKRITRFNDAYLASHAISTPEPMVFSARDGTELHGFCMRPRDYTAGRKYPAILHIHGGPKTIFGSIFHHEMQVWASHGFFVFFCNPRGSDGRGRAFADIRGRWGTVDYTDIMDFADAVLAKYHDIDAARLGVCGGSYGGFMTNWIIGHTDRFAAACSQRSFANMINFEYLSDIGLTNIRSEHLSSAEEDPARLWEESPLKYAPRCKTPTLFIHSDLDFRCPVPDALAMFSCLKRQGCPARLCLFHGENHELSRSGRPDNRISRLEEILLWFTRYLQPEIHQ